MIKNKSDFKRHDKSLFLELLNKTALSSSSQKAIIWGNIVWTILFVAWTFQGTIYGNAWLGQALGPLVFIGVNFIFGLLIASVFYFLKVKNKLLLSSIIMAPIVIRFLVISFGLKLALMLYGFYFLVNIFVCCYVRQLVNRKIFNKHIFGLSISLTVFFLIIGNLTKTPEIGHFIDKNTIPKRDLAVPSPAIVGPYKVETFTYGSGKDIQRSEFSGGSVLVTDTVDGSILLENWDGFRAFFRKIYWGFDSKALPIQGRVWKPKTYDASPLILMVHGNHSMEHFSDKGYEYLGEHLASHGYTFVSVDQNFLNNSHSEGFFEYDIGLEGTDDARAWLLLKHLEQWREWQRDPDMTLIGNVDLDNVVLIGHSRGGEAAFTAASFNKLSHFPDNAKLEFDFNFNISGVIAIAPSDGRYKPRGRLASLKNTSYLTIQGDVDADALIFMGKSAYSRVEFDSQTFNFKSSISIHGANHGQFNSDWGRCDLYQWMCDLTFYDDLIMEQGLQQEIAKVLVSSFVDIVIRKDESYLPIFQNADYLTGQFPNTYFMSNYFDSNYSKIATFEEDSNLRTGQSGLIAGTNFESWREIWLQLHPYWSGTDLNTHVVELAWNESSLATYRLSLSDSLDENSCIGFAISSAVCEIETKTAIDFTIRVADKRGETAELPLSQFRALFPLLAKKARIGLQAFYEPVFQSVRIPLAKYIKSNTKLDITQLQFMELVFNKTPNGKIYLDDFITAKCH